jgi:4-amino-4-deoxy-L-arabinose transferase-like glycosyltransferase
MYLTPVFTGLEYAALSAFGVGQWQVRTVSQVMGLLSILAIGFGVAACGGRRAGLAAAALLSTNYIWVMWNRAALKETTMVAFIAISWSAYALAWRRPIWGAVAGAAAILAFFTKAAAAFYVGALGLEALIALAGWVTSSERSRQAALWTLAGLAAAGGLFLVFFVVPYWQEFRFYNWQMSVTRKPTYGLQALVDRASWLPVVHDFFTRQWLVTVAALAACAGLVIRWRSVSGPERLLVLWVVLGILEMIVHDVGNERRFIFLVPAFVVLAVLVIVRERRLLPDSVATLPPSARWLALPLVLYAGYIVVGAIVRMPFLYEVRPSVRASAAVAALVTFAVYASWRRLGPWVAEQTWSSSAAVLLVAVLMAGDLAQFTQWAAGRTYKNVTASRLLGEWLPPGTIVQGKLANGLALDNRIKPIFVGRGF